MEVPGIYPGLFCLNPVSLISLNFLELIIKRCKLQHGL